MSGSIQNGVTSRKLWTCCSTQSEQIETSAPVRHVPDHGNVGRPSTWLKLLIDGRMRPQLWHAKSHEVRRQEFAVVVVQQNQLHWNETVALKQGDQVVPSAPIVKQFTGENARGPLPRSAWALKS
jgi:hypothetical protein